MAIVPPTETSTPVVTVTPDGRLTADSATIARLKALVAEDAMTLQGIDDRVDRVDDVVVRVAPAPGDDEVEALLGSLMVESYAAASRSYGLARRSTAPGESIALRDVYLHQAARLTRACAEVAIALMRHRGKGCQTIYVQHIKAAQAVGVVNKQGG
jgi:hypothetical protein